MKLRNVGLIVALVFALLPRPALAQTDALMAKLKPFIQKAGVYAATSTRTSPDNDVVMTRTWGIGYGSASADRGWKFPFTVSGYRADLETASGTQFGNLRTRQVMSGIGYQWVRGKMVYGAGLGVGYSWNGIALQPNAAEAFGAAGETTVAEIDNSFVIRPQLKAEYFLMRKLSLRTQVGYTYTDPDVVIQTPRETLTHEWRPHHFHLNVAVGFFPFRK